MTLFAPGTPCWESGDPDGTDAPSTVCGRIGADVAVVGAGLVGLSTAYHLAERQPSLDIVVVDARRPAAGASGRGTGLLGPRVGPPVDRAVRRHGPAVARRMHRASVEAVRHVVELCDRLGVPCADGEQIVAARSRTGLASLARQAAAYRALDLEVPVLCAADIRRRVDVPYHAGLLHRHTATLDPAALTTALARACVAKGVRLYGGSPLREVRGGDGHRPELVFPHGTVRAPKSVLAVNAGVAGLGLPVGTVLGLEVHAVATEPLGHEARALLGHGGLAVIDAVPLAPYFRLTGDGRLVVGGGTALCPDGIGPRRRAVLRVFAFHRLEQWLRALHPALAGVEVTHRWAGGIGVTADGLPVVGPVRGRPAVWYAGGCNGHGLAMSVAHGSYLAAALLGDGDTCELLPWHRSRAPRLPVSGPARPLLRARLAAMDRTARRAAGSALGPRG
ncbi:FAD-binding oxidoreductase [Streptomyces sp. NBC_00988]|uniref:NAD(P)/FAD-dependent oxidoreductase n=1 Tax=Streptomyces sp. NBC_00988 TaxID=2903704 RepID=UPI00386FB827|nr:FAD-binding oxidoreductase [Streptomyces sp. NBC_00988]